jgi:hypothetical protein
VWLVTTPGTFSLLVDGARPPPFPSKPAKPTEYLRVRESAIIAVVASTACEGMK